LRAVRERTKLSGKNGNYRGTRRKIIQSSHYTTEPLSQLSGEANVNKKKLKPRKIETKIG